MIIPAGRYSAHSTQSHPAFRAPPSSGVTPSILLDRRATGAFWALKRDYFFMDEVRGGEVERKEPTVELGAGWSCRRWKLLLRSQGVG